MKITSTNCWCNEQFVPATVTIENSVIADVVPGTSKDADFDYGDAKILPGLIDVHTHGYGGGDASDGDSDTIRNWVSYYPKEGVTTFLPGTVTRSEDRLLQALKAIRVVIEEGRKGAHIHGIFFQGPYTSHEYKGAYDPYLIQRPCVEQFKRFYEASGGTIKMIGLAVEKDENHTLLKYCVSENIKVCLGFSGASFKESAQAAQEGASSVIHCFNGMIPLHHRNPGLPGAAMSIDSLYTEIIADGIHIHPAIINIIGTCKGKDKLLVITDSSRYKGLPPGRYESVDRKVTIGEDGAGRLDNGMLAGSCITMPQSIKNLIELGGLPESTAINAATINPARMLGLDRKKGLLCQGYDADIVVLNQGYGVIQTYCAGEAML